jgi:2-keto-4-pentenoate hydratase
MDPRIESGLRRHLARHAAKLAAGEDRLGWKVAFNAPPIQQHLGLPHSLVAGLARSSLREPGERHSLEGGTRIALEAEVGVALRRDIASTHSDDEIAGAIEGLGPAIEIIDIDRGFEELEEILAEGVFHRSVVLGAMHLPTTGVSLDGVTARVELDGDEVVTIDAGLATGNPVDVLRRVAGILEPLGEGLRAGDRIILGSMNVPPRATAGCSFALSLEGWEPLRVDFDT